MSDLSPEDRASFVLRMADLKARMDALDHLHRPEHAAEWAVLYQMREALEGQLQDDVAGQFNQRDLHQRAHAILADFIRLGQPVERAIEMIRDLGIEESGALDDCLKEYRVATERIERKISEWLASKEPSRN